MVIFRGQGRENGEESGGCYQVSPAAVSLCRCATASAASYLTATYTLLLLKVFNPPWTWDFLVVYEKRPIFTKIFFIAN